MRSIRENVVLHRRRHVVESTKTARSDGWRCSGVAPYCDIFVMRSRRSLLRSWGVTVQTGAPVLRVLKNVFTSVPRAVSRRSVTVSLLLESSCWAVYE